MPLNGDRPGTIIDPIEVNSSLNRDVYQSVSRLASAPIPISAEV